MWSGYSCAIQLRLVRSSMFYRNTFSEVNFTRASKSASRNTGFCCAEIPPNIHNAVNLP
jgi:hypothetical protein